jgi:trk system potassium uptake protein TrkH
MVTMILTVTENKEFLDLLFETVSAFGTVGLSTGVTSSLSIIGKVLIIITMFAGRVGPLTLALAIGRRQTQNNNIRYPKEDVLVG